MLYTWARGDWISSWEDQVTVKHTRLDQLNGISRTTFTWRRELVGSERRVSGYKNWLFFFLIIEVLGAIHTGYTQFQSLGSGAAVSQARSRWDDRGLIGLGDDQLTPSLPNRPTAYLASYPQDKFILATCFFFSLSTPRLQMLLGKIGFPCQLARGQPQLSLSTTQQSLRLP